MHLAILATMLFWGSELKAQEQTPVKDKDKKADSKKEDKPKPKGFSVLTTEVAKQDYSFQAYEFFFPNINKVFEYKNPELLKIVFNGENKIRSAKDEGERLFLLRDHIPVLESYVSQFGIRNFYNETHWLWRLGQAYEKIGQRDKAKSLFRLTLKHTRQDVTRIARHYDSVTVNSREYYVPLKYYYELVEYRKNIDTLRPPESVLTPMSENVNDPKYNDYAPALSFTNDTLLFTSKRKPRKANPKQMNEDLYMSRYDEGIWEECKPLTDINTEFNEGSAVFGKNGKELIFTRCDAPDGYGNCDLYIAYWVEDEKGKGKWTDITNLGPRVNGLAWESHPSLSPSGDTLYFASNRLGGFGLSDIYFTVRQKNGTWSLAENIGPVVNTRHNEVSPFFHPVHSVLYFSSDGQMLNFGNVEIYNNIYKPYFDKTRYREGKNLKASSPAAKQTFDIYKSYYRDGQFQEPKNVGPLINGPGDEYYFTINRNSSKLFFAKSPDTSIHNLNLYSFPLPMEAQPLATTKLSGQLLDEMGFPFRGIVAVIDVERGIEVAPRAIRPDGTFDFDLIKDSKYLLVIQGDEFFRIEEMFVLHGDTTIAKTAKNIKNTKITFQSIQFTEASDEVLPSMFEDLQNIINFLVDNPRYRLQISGHTDLRGDKKNNLRLSQARANAIKAYLCEGGIIKPWRIEAIGFGDAKPLVQVEKTEADRERNRRVEFELITPKPE